MNYSKLNELAAKAMGYEELHLPKDGGRNPFVMYSRPGMDNIVTGDWNPSTCADDALRLLEKVTGGEWTLASYHPPESGDIEFDCYTIRIQAGANTAPLAMTLCALRASNIPESEITAAME